MLFSRYPNNLTFEYYATSAKVLNIKYLHYKMWLQISEEEQIREHLQKQLIGPFCLSAGEYLYVRTSPLC